MILLDTCTLLWLVHDQTHLSKDARSKIISSRGNIYVSSISALEIGIKHRRKKLQFTIAPEEWFAKSLERHGIHEIPVSAAIAFASSSLPMIHNDPFDRIIIGTAIEEELTIISPDKNFFGYEELKVLW